MFNRVKNFFQKFSAKSKPEEKKSEEKKVEIETTIAPNPYLLNSAFEKHILSSAIPDDYTRLYGKKENIQHYIKRLALRPNQEIKESPETKRIRDDFENQFYHLLDAYVIWGNENIKIGDEKN